MLKKIILLCIFCMVPMHAGLGNWLSAGKKFITNSSGTTKTAAILGCGLLSVIGAYKTYQYFNPPTKFTITKLDEHIIKQTDDNVAQINMQEKNKTDETNLYNDAMEKIELLIKQKSFKQSSLLDDLLQDEYKKLLILALQHDNKEIVERILNVLKAKKSPSQEAHPKFTRAYELYRNDLENHNDFLKKYEKFKLFVVKNCSDTADTLISYLFNAIGADKLILLAVESDNLNLIKILHKYGLDFKTYDESLKNITSHIDQYGEKSHAALDYILDQKLSTFDKEKISLLKGTLDERRSNAEALMLVLKKGSPTNIKKLMTLLSQRYTNVCDLFNLNSVRPLERCLRVDKNGTFKLDSIKICLKYNEAIEDFYKDLPGDYYYEDYNGPTATLLKQTAAFKKAAGEKNLSSKDILFHNGQLRIEDPSVMFGWLFNQYYFDTVDNKSKERYKDALDTLYKLNAWHTSTALANLTVDCDEDTLKRFKNDCKDKEKRITFHQNYNDLRFNYLP